MENLAADTSLVESYLWISSALLYLPFGVLVAVIVLDIIDIIQDTRENDRAILILLVLGIVSTFFAAHIGAALVFFLGDWGNFPFRKLLPAYALGVIFLVTWALKFVARRSWQKAARLALKHQPSKHRTSSSRGLTAAYRFTLIIAALLVAYCVSFKADFGETPAFVTLGVPGRPDEIQSPPPLPAPTPPPVAVAEPETKAADNQEPEVDPNAPPQPQPLPAILTASTPMPENLTILFKKDVEPILKTSCYECHGASKDKGDLRLHTPADIRKGTGDDPVVTPGKPEDSPLYFLTTLSPDDDDIMPSKGDPLTKEETEILRTWILEGAYLADGHAVDDASAAENAAASEDPESLLSRAVVIPNPQFLQMLRDDGIVVNETAEEFMLEIDYSKAKKAPGEIDLKILYPIARNIVGLDLSRTKVSDDDLEPIEEFTNLVTLRLDRTNTGDSAMRYLSDLEKLESVNLFATRVSDYGTSYLEDLKTLKQIVVINTQVSAHAVDKLRKSLPKAEIQAAQ